MYEIWRRLRQHRLYAIKHATAFAAKANQKEVMEHWHGMQWMMVPPAQQDPHMEGGRHRHTAFTHQTIRLSALHCSSKCSGCHAPPPHLGIGSLLGLAGMLDGMYIQITAQISTALPCWYLIPDATQFVLISIENRSNHNSGNISGKIYKKIFYTQLNWHDSQAG